MRAPITDARSARPERQAERPPAGPGARRLLGLFATVALVLGVSGAAVACGGESPAPAAGEPSPAAPAYSDITPDQLAAMLQEKDFVLVNTHVPYEGEIEQTDLFLPYDQAADLIDQLPADKSAKIVVYCRSDRMSRIAVEQWAAAGYTNLFNLAGGFVAWEAAGYPLLQREGQ